MADNENGASGLGWFLAGLGIGALIGVLYAPKSGRETREDIKSGALEAKEKAAILAQRAKVPADLRGDLTNLLLADLDVSSLPVQAFNDPQRNWFVRVLLRQPELGRYFAIDGVEDSELVPLDDAVWEDDVEVWRDACNASRTAASHHSLDDTGLRDGEPCSLRWIYVHMIEEYARHNGHADLIRELVDGSVGW